MPFCTLPIGRPTQYYPPSRLSKNLLPNCAKIQPVQYSDGLTYLFCYGSPCYPGSGNLIENLPLRLKQFPRQLTGGHCHADDQRPIGSPAAGDSIDGNTGPDGLGFVVSYIWPEVSGAINTVLYTPKDIEDTLVINEAHDTLYINCVRVANQVGFAQLPLSGTNYYSYGADSDHPENNWGDPRLVGALEALAIGVRDSIPGLPTMGFNDISLVWGGLFDEAGSGSSRPPYWTQPHCSHRSGTAADFKTRGLLISDRQFANRLSKVIRHYGFAAPHKEADHWHLSYIGP